MSMTLAEENSPPRKAAFENGVAKLRREALASGIPALVFENAFKNVEADLSVLEYLENQPEHVRAVWDYIDRATSETRIAEGRAKLSALSHVLSNIVKKYKVDPAVVVAIWGLESSYGTSMGSKNVVRSLATLAVFGGRRAAFGKSQLMAALKILKSGDVKPQELLGSWAGAMGHTQFIPSSYLAYAQDFRGDGRRDIWGDDPTDALASTANYLARAGWVHGQPWGMEVRLPRGFDFNLAGERVKKPTGDWNRLGVRTPDGRPVPDHGTASILLPAGAQGAAFIIFKNFHVIERYNTADAYVIAVGHLADRIRGAGPLHAGWPRDDRPLSLTEKKELQKRLIARGYDTRGIDGIIGPNTIAAVRAFQSSAGIVPDGYTSLKILRRLR